MQRELTLMLILFPFAGFILNSAFAFSRSPDLHRRRAQTVATLTAFLSFICAVILCFTRWSARPEDVLIGNWLEKVPLFPTLKMSPTPILKICPSLAGAGFSGKAYL